jgi:hypothetical protein
MNTMKNECEKVDTPMIAKWSGIGIEIKCWSYQVRDIASTLLVGLGTVKIGNLFQQHKSRENLQYHTHERVLEEYQNCMTGMK